MFKKHNIEENREKIIHLLKDNIVSDRELRNWFRKECQHFYEMGIIHDDKDNLGFHWQFGNVMRSWQRELMHERTKNIIKDLDKSPPQSGGDG